MSCFRALALTLSLSAPVAAEGIEENESLVMQLIFQDCLGFVADDTRPFTGLTVLPLSPEVEADLPKAAFLVPNRQHVVSARYYAIWGEDTNTRYCMIQPVYGSRLPALLGVKTDGILDRLTARAAEVGMTETDIGAVFDPLHVHTWREPGGDGEHELRMVVLPTAESANTEVVDVGFIIVAAGTDWRHD
jgi:hypothetical protein